MRGGLTWLWIAAASGSLIVGCSSNKSSGTTDAGGAERHPSITAVAASLQALSDADTESMRAYMRTTGAILRTFHDGIGALVRATSGESPKALTSVCTSVAAALQSVDPTVLLEAAQDSPDPVIGDLFITERRAVSDALVACDGGEADTMNRALQSLRDADALLEPRLTGIVP